MFKFIYVYRTLLALVILASILAIITNGTALLQGPMSDAAPNAAEWLSAISTFWGAVATALGAALTGGALLIAAMTYRRQVADRHQELADQHRAQATAVTVLVALKGGMDGRHFVRVDISNNLSIYNMELVCLDSMGGQLERFVKHVVTREFSQYIDDALPLHEAVATFTDSAGVRWQRSSKGKLVDLGREPADFDIVETPEASYEERNKELQERMQRRQTTGEQ